MAEIRVTSLACGERGKRGKQGPTGPTGPSSGALIGRQVFDTLGSGTYTPTPGTTKAIVRGSGGGGGGGGCPLTGGSTVSVGAGGNSGVAIEVEINPGGPLTSGPFTVGAGGAGGIGVAGAPGADSTLVIGGVTLTAPGGRNGLASTAGTPPFAVPGTRQFDVTSGVDYQACDQGGAGQAFSTTSALGGTGGSGDYGIGGAPGVDGANGSDGQGNGAGGGGASALTGSAAANGGSGTNGIWIIEEYS